MESRLDRITELAESTLRRLESEERLSDILSQVRLLAEMNGDNAYVAWLDCEIYGLLHVPLGKIPREKLDDKLGGLLHTELHTVPDIGTMDYEKVIHDAFKKDSLLEEHNAVTPLSIRQLEDVTYEEPRVPPYTRDQALLEFRTSIWAQEAERVVHRVRSYAHQYVGTVWENTIREKENQSLLGPNYRIVIDNIDALETGVGQELTAALENLRNENPANWKLAALGCRNVIIKLGDSLWKVPCTTYFSELDNKELDLVGEKEKNRLYAYIDYHYQRAEREEDRNMLKQGHDKIWRIYDIGSKAKRAIRHEEAKTVVVDAFELVGDLDEITELKPLEEI